MVYYHSIGAGVDAILTPDLVESAVVLASEKGEVGIHLAEHAFALLLGLTRGLHTALRRPDYELREPIRREQRELWEQTMGIVGFGGTGRAVARRALGFGMRVLAVDVEDVERMAGVEAVWKPDRMPELLAASDVVVIGLPLTKATHHVFSRDLFPADAAHRDSDQRHARRHHLRGEDVLGAPSTKASSGAPASTSPTPNPCPPATGSGATHASSSRRTRPADHRAAPDGSSRPSARICGGGATAGLSSRSSTSSKGY